MKRIALASALLVVSFGAVAGDIGYNLFEVGYLNVDGEADGITAKVSTEFGATGLYGTLGYSRLITDAFDVDINVAATSLGYAHTLVEGTDVTGEFGYQRARALGETTDGYRASVGIARSFNDRFQGGLKANRYFGGDGGTDTTVSMAGEVYFNPTWSVAAEVEIADAGETTLLALHYNF